MHPLASRCNFACPLSGATAAFCGWKEGWWEYRDGTKTVKWWAPKTKALDQCYQLYLQRIGFRSCLLMDTTSDFSRWHKQHPIRLYIMLQEGQYEFRQLFGGFGGSEWIWYETQSGVNFLGKLVQMWSPPLQLDLTPSLTKSSHILPLGFSRCDNLTSCGKTFTRG